MIESTGRGAVVVVGAGVIGLSVAWRLAASGARVRVVDPRPCAGASWVAGGMLAPITEAWPGEESLLDLGVAAVARWPAFAARLREVAVDPRLRTEGTLVAAFDAADHEQLEMLADHLAARGRAVDRLTGRELRSLEPSLSRSVRSGLSVPGDLSVDSRKLLHALRDAAGRCGVDFVEATATAARGGAVDLDDGSVLDGDAVVLCAGAWSRDLHDALKPLVRPVKGEILLLRARRGVITPQRTVRASVESRPVYLVPRDGGEVVLGATQYEAGFDTEVTVAGVRDLLADAQRLVPGLGEFALVECGAGLRAGSRDNLPLIGWLEPGLLVATGHHRNGVLLAPITADAVLALLSGRSVPQPVAAADLDRFEGKGVSP